jgi:hypothetical protein
MQRQYTLSFYPSELPDGKWHSLRVGLQGVPNSKKFVLTYRQGYQATSGTKRQSSIGGRHRLTVTGVSRECGLMIAADRVF